MNIQRKKSRKLDMSSRNLTKFPSITTLDKKIRSLDLSNNNIEEIPGNIEELKVLIPGDSRPPIPVILGHPC